MLRKILVALDSGDTCVGVAYPVENRLFSKAVALARLTHAELMLTSVLTLEDSHSNLSVPAAVLADYPVGINAETWSIYQEGYRAYEEKSLQRLQDFCDRAQAVGVKAKFSQSFGSPGKVICDRASSWQADLIMVGSHGRRGLQEFFVGSVSNYVMHRAPCSVTVVREQKLSTDAEFEEAIASGDTHQTSARSSTSRFSAIKRAIRNV